MNLGGAMFNVPIPGRVKLKIVQLECVDLPLMMQY
jgi:hypothetical protein